MERIRLGRKKWPLLLSLSLCAAFEALLYLLVTRHAISAALEGRALEGEWGWASIIGWHAFIAAVGLALAWQPFAELRTVYTDEGISRPRPFKRAQLIRWDEAESVYVAPLNHRPYRVRVNAPGRSLEINALYYQQPQELLELIEQKMLAATPAREAR